MLDERTKKNYFEKLDQQSSDWSLEMHIFDVIGEDVALQRVENYNLQSQHVAECRSSYIQMLSTPSKKVSETCNTHFIHAFWDDTKLDDMQ